MNPTLKAIFFSAFVAITAFIAVLSTSCNKNKCNGIICANDGVCNNGACTCPYGYEGPTCERLIRQKFTGNFMVFEKGSASLAHQYPIHIVEDTAGALPELLIYNCYNYFRQPIKAYAQGDTLIIPNQQLQGKVIYGQGTIAYDVTYAQYGDITMRYVVQDTASDVTDDYGYESYADHSDPSSWNK